MGSTSARSLSEASSAGTSRGSGSSSAAARTLTRSLAGEYFRTDSIWEREQERIFGRHWLYVCHVGDLAEQGSFVCSEVGEESVVVVRSEHGVRAFHNVCRHRGTRLCWEQRGKHRKAMVCPYHSWAYSFEGDLVGAANMEELPGFDPAEYALLPVAVEVREGLVFVRWSEQGPTLDEALPHLEDRVRPWGLEDLVPVTSREYLIEANWKLFFQNYSECYHCPTAHPALNRLTPYRGSSNDLDQGAMLGGPMNLRAEVESMSTTGKRCARPLSGLDAERQRRVYYYTVFPNLFLSLHPDYLLVHRIDPLSKDLSRIRCWWYFDRSSAEDPRFDASPAVEFWHQTNEQDWELCRQAHRGVTSRAYVPGPYAAIESMVAAFDREYLAALGDAADDPVASASSSEGDPR